MNDVCREERRVEQMAKEKSQVLGSGIALGGRNGGIGGFEELKMALIARKHRMHGRKTLGISR